MNEPKMFEEVLLLSSISISLAVISFFLSELLAVGIAFLAVMVVFLASRRKERYFVYGMLLGAIILNFVCLQYMGILKPETKTQVENVYRSLRLSQKVFGMMKGDNPDEMKMVPVIDQMLQIAREVDTELLDSSLPSFKQHFENEYIEGYTLLKQGMADSDIGEKLKGSILADSWAKWNIDNMDELEKLRRSKPSLISFALSIIK